MKAVKRVDTMKNIHIMEVPTIEEFCSSIAKKFMPKNVWNMLVVSQRAWSQNIHMSKLYLQL